MTKQDLIFRCITKSNIFGCCAKAVELEIFNLTGVYNMLNVWSQVFLWELLSADKVWKPDLHQQVLGTVRPQLSRNYKVFLSLNICLH